MDTLRLEIVPAGDDAGGGFALEVWVDDVEMTGSAAGLGMDPYDLLVPTNRLVPERVPRTVPLARCGCGVYGCAETDVEITRTPSSVRWRWLKQKPGRDLSEFDRTQYVEEVMRVAADHSWETRERTAGRLVLVGLHRTPLGHELQPDWVGSWRDDELLRVCLRHLDRHQVFVDFAWDGRSPEELATAVLDELTTKSPSAWSASWHPIRQGEAPPSMAAPAWGTARS